MKKNKDHESKIKNYTQLKRRTNNESGSLIHKGGVFVQDTEKIANQLQINQMPMEMSNVNGDRHDSYVE
jgi:hypothetical protein